MYRVRDAARAVAAFGCVLALVGGCATGTSGVTTAAGGASSGPATASATAAGSGQPSRASQSPQDSASFGSGNGVRTCQAAQLSATFTPLPGVAAGSNFADLVLTNSSAQTCQLTGAAQVRFDDEQHRLIPVRMQVFPGQPGFTPPKVVLAPGASAAERLQYSSDGNPPPGQQACAPTESYLEITPPGSESALIVALPPRAHCPHDGVQVTQLVAGTSGPSFP